MSVGTGITNQAQTTADFIVGVYRNKYHTSCVHIPSAMDQNDFNLRLFVYLVKRNINSNIPGLRVRYGRKALGHNYIEFRWREVA